MICESCFTNPSDTTLSCDACKGAGKFHGITKDMEVVCGQCNGKGCFGRCNACLGIYVQGVTYTLLHEYARVPTKGTPGSVGFDLYAVESVPIPVCGVRKIPLGIALELPPGTWAQICPRSGMASRGMIGILGTIDPDYRGELCAMIMNLSGGAQSVMRGDKCAQLVIHATQDVLFAEGAISETRRGTDGFGSTGK